MPSCLMTVLLPFLLLSAMATGAGPHWAEKLSFWCDIALETGVLCWVSDAKGHAEFRRISQRHGCSRVPLVDCVCATLLRDGFDLSYKQCLVTEAPKAGLRRETALVFRRWDWRDVFRVIKTLCCSPMFAFLMWLQLRAAIGAMRY